MAQTVKSLTAMRETVFDPWVGKIPCRRKWQPIPVLLPGKFPGWRSLAGYSLWSLKESDTTEQFHFTSKRISEKPKMPLGFNSYYCA